MKGIDPVEWHSGTAEGGSLPPENVRFSEMLRCAPAAGHSEERGVRVSRTQGTVLRQRLPPLFSPTFPS